MPPSTWQSLSLTNGVSQSVLTTIPGEKHSRSCSLWGGCSLLRLLIALAQVESLKKNPAPIDLLVPFGSDDIFGTSLHRGALAQTLSTESGSGRSFSGCIRDSFQRIIAVRG